MTLDPLWVPDRGEVISIDHSLAKGQEIPDQHPMLVLSPKRFNEKTGIVIGFPMTHADTHKDNPFALPFRGTERTGIRPRSPTQVARGVVPDLDLQLSIEAGQRHLEAVDLIRNWSRQPV